MGFENKKKHYSVFQVKAWGAGFRHKSLIDSFTAHNKNGIAALLYESVLIIQH